MQLCTKFTFSRARNDRNNPLPLHHRFRSASQSIPLYIILDSPLHLSPSAPLSQTSACSPLALQATRPVVFRQASISSACSAKGLQAEIPNSRRMNNVRCKTRVLKFCHEYFLTLLFLFLCRSFLDLQVKMHHLAYKLITFNKQTSK